MKNQTNRKKYLFLTALAFALLLAASFSVFAQAENTDAKYKVGDRVGCDFKFNGEYKPGTVVEVFVNPMAGVDSRYRVKIDNDDPLWKDGRNCWDKNMRAIDGETNKNQNKPETPRPTPGKNTKKPNPDEPEDFTYLADREIMECPIEQKPVKNGAKPAAELLQKVIRCLYERRAPAGITGAKTVDITAFQIGASRKWRPLDDIGSGNASTIVYPVKASWTEKTFYESYTQQIDSISMFNCYVNAVGEWECGLAQRIKESDIKRIPR